MYENKTKIFILLGILFKTFSGRNTVLKVFEPSQVNCAGCLQSQKKTTQIIAHNKPSLLVEVIPWWRRVVLKQTGEETGLLHSILVSKLQAIFHR